MKQLSESPACTLTRHPKVLTPQRCPCPVLTGITTQMWFPCPCPASEPYRRLCREEGRAGEGPQARASLQSGRCVWGRPHAPSPACLLPPLRAPACPARGRTTAACPPPPAGSVERAEGCSEHHCPSVYPSLGQVPAAPQGPSRLSQLAHTWLGGKGTSLYPHGRVAVGVHTGKHVACSLLRWVPPGALVWPHPDLPIGLPAATPRGQR